MSLVKKIIVLAFLIFCLIYDEESEILNVLPLLAKFRGGTHLKPYTPVQQLILSPSHSMLLIFFFFFVIKREWHDKRAQNVFPLEHLFG